MVRLDYPRSGVRTFDEETLNLYGEFHPASHAGKSSRHEAEGSLDALGPDRYPEAG
jgi:hypothetical protein